LIAAQQFSFPSGHAMVAAAFYLYLASLTRHLIRGWWRAILITAAVLLVLLIGLARIYLGAHYATDVMAGYLAGLLWTDAVIVGSRVVRPRARRRHDARTRQLFERRVP
jgi:membrane-associated phospholipid phosphatase